MSAAHEKANRNDKAQKVDYWEEWSKGKIPGTWSGLKTPVEFSRDTRRTLRFVQIWNPEEVLDEGLIHQCRSMAGRRDKDRMLESVCGTKVVYLPMEEAALWVRDSMDFLKPEVKRYRAIRTPSHPAEQVQASTAEIIEELHSIKSVLGGLFPIEEALASGVVPASFIETEVASEPTNLAALHVFLGFLHLRGAVDLYLTYKDAKAKVQKRPPKH